MMTRDSGRVGSIWMLGTRILRPPSSSRMPDCLVEFTNLVLNLAVVMAGRNERPGGFADSNTVGQDDCVSEPQDGLGDPAPSVPSDGSCMSPVRVPVQGLEILERFPEVLRKHLSGRGAVSGR